MQYSPIAFVDLCRTQSIASLTASREIVFVIICFFIIMIANLDLKMPSLGIIGFPYSFHTLCGLIKTPSTKIYILVFLIKPASDSFP